MSWLRELQVKEETVSTVEAERLSGMDIAALSVEDLEADLGCSKLQAKKIVNRVAQQRAQQQAAGEGKTTGGPGLVPLRKQGKDGAAGSLDWAVVLDSKKDAGALPPSAAGDAERASRCGIAVDRGAGAHFARVERVRA